jgi:hypothetical protein
LGIGECEFNASLPGIEEGIPLSINTSSKGGKTKAIFVEEAVEIVFA